MGIEPVLSIQGLSLRLGGIAALNAVSFEVQSNSICGLIGPNGAGKTTLFNCLSRLHQPDAGDILLGGQSLLRRPPHALARLGLGRTFQHGALFGGLSVRANVMLGAHGLKRRGFLADALGLRAGAREEARLADRADHLMARLGVLHLAALPVGQLDLAAQRRVELARALAGAPQGAAAGRAVRRAGASRGR